MLWGLKRRRAARARQCRMSADLCANTQGGTLDLVVLITAPPPPPPPPPPEEGEEAEEVEPPPEPSEEEKAEREEFLAQGRAREKAFVDLQALVGTETNAQSTRSHKIVANVCFDTLQLTAADPEAETYCNAEVCDSVKRGLLYAKSNLLHALISRKETYCVLAFRDMRGAKRARFRKN